MKHQISENQYPKHQICDTPKYPKYPKDDIRNNKYPNTKYQQQK